MPQKANLFDIFGLGFFFGASTDIQMEDNLVRWEPVELDKPTVEHRYGECDANNIGFKFNMVKERVTQVKYLGFPEIEGKVVAQAMFAAVLFKLVLNCLYKK